MRIEQWEPFKKVVKPGQTDRMLLSLIIDSARMPGHPGISHVDFYFGPDVWFNSNLKILKEFPDLISFPCPG